MEYIIIQDLFTNIYCVYKNTPGRQKSKLVIKFCKLEDAKNYIKSKTHDNINYNNHITNNNNT